MTYNTAPAPHLRRTERSAMLSANVLIAFVPLGAVSFVYYGPRPIVLMLTGMLAALLCEALGCLLMRRKLTSLDITALVTGGLVGAVMSPVAPYWMPVVGAAFAILVVKMPMGGSGRNVFNPAAAGIAVLTVCFPARMFTYPTSVQTGPLPMDSTVEMGARESAESLASLLRNPAANPTMEPLKLLIGDFAGPLGATAIAVLAAVFLFLIATRTAAPSIALPYLATCALLALMMPRTAPGLNGVLVELCAGYLLFAGVFMLSDPVTAPRYWVARVIYGVCAGLLVMALRYFGKFEEGACFAVLIVNAFSSTIDRVCWYLVNIRRRMMEKVL